MRNLLAVTAVLLVTSAAHAEVYNYGCQVTNERSIPQVYVAQLDTGKRTITWRGKVFRNLKQLDGCKAEFEATASDGNVAHLCTATQGVASLDVNVRSRLVDDVVMDGLECNLIHK